MTAATSREHGPEQRSTLRRVAVGAMVGNVVEWFDFAVFGCVAVALSANFFPATSPVAGLLQTFAVFAVAFVLRPVGGLVLGPLGDRFGRRRVLSLTVLLIAGSTAVVGLLRVRHPDHPDDLGDDVLGRVRRVGWRVPFLVAAPLGVLGFYIRHTIRPPDVTVASVNPAVGSSFSGGVIDRAQPIGRAGERLVRRWGLQGRRMVSRTVDRMPSASRP